MPSLAAHSATRRALGLTLLGFALSATWASLSEGALQDDDLKHFQIAQWSACDPRYLLDPWGRPGFTALYALPAQGGWLAARWWSALLSALTAWWSFRIAQGLRLRFAWLVPALLWMQPLFFTLSYTTLTETALAFYLAAAMRLFQLGRHTASAATISLCILTRHEAVLLVLPWCIAFHRERAPLRAWAALAWAPLAHNVLAYFILGHAPILSFLEPKPTEIYGSGAWLSMFLNAHVAFSAAIFLLAGCGAVALAARKHAWLWLVAGMLWLVAHSAIYRFGLFASAGYPRFLVPIAPVIATSAACGLELLWRLARIAKRRRVGARAKLAIAAGILPMIALTGAGIYTALPSTLEWLRAQMLVALVVAAVPFGAAMRGRSFGYRGLVLGAAVLWSLQVNVLWFGRPPIGHALPLRYTTEQRALRDAALWIERHRPSAARIEAATDSPWLEEFLGGWRAWLRPPLGERASSLEEGDLLLWDAKYAPREHASMQLDALRESGDWVELFASDVLKDANEPKPFARVFEKRSAARPSGR